MRFPCLREGGEGRYMAASLLRKGLELFNQEPQDQAPVAKKKKRSAGGSDRTELIGTNKKGARKQLEARRRLKERPTVKDKVTKSAIEEFHKRQPTDHLDQNLQYMLGTKFMTDSSVTEQVLAQNRGRRAQDRLEEKPKAKGEKSVFTEKDFQKFQREYFGGKVGAL
ncbi:ribosomal protein S19 binding protein 1 [Latimeria chalumnae]|uniref:Active regulator of SIRT1 n=1 Tax=Latimeria chalumnae TaxID=7897 RepID=M3XKT2_LATCH|nr:PREDICTED: active regulator of SIRT1 [Latimeria chalumnae]|eukprot:XP_006006936.1 PREDICTED: active regulator of SIRT1 [Latimeria chalumnae]